MNFFGAHVPMQYYEMNSLYSPTCDDNGPSSAFAHDPSCPAYNCVLHENRTAGNNTCKVSQLYSKPPMDKNGGLYSMLRMLQPDTIIVNSGLWTNFTIQKSEQLANLLEDFQKRGARLVWKTTTATKLPTGNIIMQIEFIRKKYNILGIADFPDDAARNILPNRGWKIYDTNKLTKPLTEYAIVDGKNASTNPSDSVEAMWDQRHFYDWVYRGLNEVLIVDLLK